MDFIPVSTMTLSFFVAVACGFVAYKLTIREARKEISSAIKDHLSAMHRDHIEFVRDVKSDIPDNKP